MDCSGVGCSRDCDADREPLPASRASMAIALDGIAFGSAIPCEIVPSSPIDAFTCIVFVGSLCVLVRIDGIHREVLAAFVTGCKR